MTFHVGQKVVCVNAGPISGEPLHGLSWVDGDGPQVGTVYTVKKLARDNTGSAVLHLIELRRGPVARKCWGRNAGYDPSRFRPIVSRKTDISIFTAMLNPSQVKVDALNTADFARESAQ